MASPRVLMVHQAADLYGSDRMLLASVSAYRDAGWSVVVSVPVPGALVPALRERGAEVLVTPTVVLRKSQLRPAGLVRLLARAPGALVRAIRVVRGARPNLLYVNTVAIPVWAVAGRLARVPVLVHVHEAEPDLARWLQRAVTAPLLLARTVVVNSQAAASVMTAAIPRLARRIRLVYNGVAGPARPAPLPARAPVPLRLLLVGRLARRKGTDVAIAALIQLRERGCPTTLELVGSAFPGNEAYEQQVRSLAERCGEAVTITGFTPSVWSAYERCDVALVPSRIEPFGNVAVEAQLAQRPVIVSRLPGLLEAVGGEQGAIVIAPGDPVALADAVEDVIGDWAGAASRAEAARAVAVRRFALDRYERDIVYAGLVTARLTRYSAQ